jgi:glycosyltransferase involved in cell wall biosynthesis
MPRALIILCNRYAFDARSQRHAEALAERGYDTDVICLASPAVAKKHDRVNLIELNWRRYQGSRRFNYLRTYSRFFSAASLIALRRSAGKPYDLILASTMPDPIVLCALPARLFGGRIVLDIRDTMPELYQEKFSKGPADPGTRMLFAQERLCARLADRVIAVHEPHRRRLEQAGIPKEKLDIVMNTPDPRIFTARSRRALNSHGPSDAFTLIYHGTVTHRLGLDVAIEAVSLLRDRIPSLRMIVLGTGDELPSVKSLAASLNLGERVTFPDTAPVEKLPEILSQADLGVVPNRATVATQLMLPVKLLEYAMSEIPVVAPRLNTIQYYFNDDAVRYFAPGDPVDLANAIEELYRNPSRRNDQARHAAEVVARLSWASEKEKFNRIIDSVTGWSFAESRPVAQ